MGLYFIVQMTWEDFWYQQQVNPYNELAFMYNNKCYILLHCDYAWMISEYNPDTYDVGKTLAIEYEKNPGHKNYHGDANWNDMVDTCYRVLTLAIFGKKSFKDIIEDIIFED